MKGSQLPPNQLKMFFFFFLGGWGGCGKVQRDKECSEVREASWTHTVPGGRVMRDEEEKIWCEVQG